MKKFATSIYAVSVLFTFAAVQPMTARGAGTDWVEVDRNEESVFSYDKAGITTPQEGILRVTTRAVYTDKGRIQTQATLKPAADYEKLSETRFVVGIDCRQWKSSLLRVAHYDATGKELKAFSLEGMTGWEDIPHDARMEQIAKTECHR